MATAANALIALLAGGAGYLGEKGAQKETKRKEQMARDLLSQKARDEAALEATKYVNLPPAVLGEYNAFLTHPPEEQVSANAEIARMLNGSPTPYSPAAQRQIQDFSTSPSVSTIPDFLAGNPLLHEAAVAHLAGQQPRRSAGGKSGGGTSELQGILTRAEIETGRDLGPAGKAIDLMVGGPARDQMLEDLRMKKNKYLTSNVMRRFEAQYNRAPTLQEMSNLLGDRFDEPTFQGLASTKIRQGAATAGKDAPAPSGKFSSSTGFNFE